MMYKMKCGHTANATSGGKPACAICSCLEVERECRGNEGLEGRTAKCTACTNTTPSEWGLAFFEHRPDKERDAYYCGCFGWD